MLVRDLEQTSRVSIEFSILIERSGIEWNGNEWMCRFHDGITDRFWHDQREWMEHLWMKSNQSNNQYLRLISIELPGMNNSQTI